MGDLYVRSEVAFGRGLWLRLRRWAKNWGNGVMVWGFAGDVDKETNRCERGVNYIHLHCNINFMPNNILSNFITRSKNYENYSPYRMNFVCNEIVNFFKKN